MADGYEGFDLYTEPGNMNVGDMLSTWGSPDKSNPALSDYLKKVAGVIGTNVNDVNNAPGPGTMAAAVNPVEARPVPAPTGPSAGTLAAIRYMADLGAAIGNPNSPMTGVGKVTSAYAGNLLANKERQKMIQLIASGGMGGAGTDSPFLWGLLAPDLKP